MPPFPKGAMGPRTQPLIWPNFPGAVILAERTQGQEPPGRARRGLPVGEIAQPAGDRSQAVLLETKASGQEPREPGQRPGRQEGQERPVGASEEDIRVAAHQVESRPQVSGIIPREVTAIGRGIAAFRARFIISAEEAAQRAGEGITGEVIGQLERGRHFLPIDDLLKVTHGLQEWVRVNRGVIPNAEVDRVVEQVQTLRWMRAIARVQDRHPEGVHESRILGNVLRVLRLAESDSDYTTQADWGRIVGIHSERTVSEYENGDVIPNASTLREILRRSVLRELPPGNKAEQALLLYATADEIEGHPERTRTLYQRAELAVCSYGTFLPNEKHD